VWGFKSLLVHRKALWAFACTRRGLGSLRLRLRRRLREQVPPRALRQTNDKTARPLAIIEECHEPFEKERSDALGTAEVRLKQPLVVFVLVMVGREVFDRW
jgi:hypothetical protein